jgi:hypothetical protein
LDCYQSFETLEQPLHQYLLHNLLRFHHGIASKKGTQQGCVLASLLYSLAEHAQNVHYSEEIMMMMMIVLDTI